MDKTRHDIPKATETLILEAAMKEFSTKGYDGARTATIAAEAGVTHAMLHYYFRTKERLFKRIFEEKIKDIMQLVFASIIEAQGSIKDRIQRGVESHFDILLQNRWIPVFFVTTLNSKPEMYEEIFRELVDTADMRIGRLQNEFDKAHDEGEIKKIDVAMLFGDIASLNVFPFIATPMFMAATGFRPDQEAEFFAARRKENVEIILNRIS